MDYNIIKFFTLILLVVNFIFGFEIGQIKNFKFIDGLSSNTITDIAIDGQNRAWVGTYNGISMFNGLRFENYYNDNSISEKFIHCVYANDIDVWFGTTEALLKLDDSINKLEIKEFLKFPNGISNIVTIGSDRLYAVTKNKLLSIKPTTKHVKEIDFRNIEFVLPFGKENLIISTNTKLYSYDIKTGKKKLLKNIGVGINSIMINGMELLVGSNDGLYRFDLSSSSFDLIKNHFKNKNIEAINVARNEIFISVENALYKIQENSIIKLNLAFKKIKSIGITKDDILLVGSFGDGLSQIDPYSLINHSKFAKKQNVQIKKSVNFKGDLFFATPNGLYSQKQNKFILNQNIFDIAVESNKYIWIATQKGIFKYSKKGINKINLDSVNPEISVLSIEIDKMGRKWFGTMKGLIKFDDRNNKSDVFVYNTADGLISNIIYDVCQVSGGIVTTSANGINYLKNYKKINTFELSSDDYNSCIFDEDGDALWVSTAQSGVKKIDLESGEIIESYSISNGLSNNEILNLSMDKNSNLWVSTDGGGISFFNGEVWGSLDSRDGLINNSVYDIYQNIDGKYIISTNSGYSIYERKETKSQLNLTQIIGANKKGKNYFAPEESKIYLNVHPIDYITNTKKYIFRYSLGDQWIYSYGNSNIEIDKIESGLYNLKLEYIDRDLNVSDTKTINLEVLKPWYMRKGIAIPLFGGIFIFFLSSIYFFYIYTRKRKHVEYLKEKDIKRQFQELEEARNFQMGMLPDSTPSVLNLDIATHINTAEEVGGDYYDFFIQKKSNSLIVAIGDATGHGMIAGNIVSITKAGLSSVNFESPINEILENLNKIIKKVGIGRNRMCLNICHVTEGHFEVCSAGMPPTYIYKNKMGIIEEVMISGLPAGSLKNSKYSSEKFEFNTNDILVMITDGLPECENNEGEFVGYNRIKDVIVNNSTKTAGEIKNHLTKLGHDWMAGNPITDDITFVVIKKC